jgi:molybdopterin-dependent oxidoreductase-like protein
MRAFTFQRVAAAEDAARAVAARPGAMFLAGGTTLVDLMKVDVLTPDSVVDVRHLGMSNIDVSDDAISVGATVTNSQLAWHPVVRDRSGAIAEAIGRQVTFVDVPPQAFASALGSAGVPPWQADGLIEDYAHYARGEAAAVSSHVSEVTGTEPRDIRTFARDYARAFVGV